uniref:Zinc knuckle CX2CX4HX4C n=1 Tax=Tanacetum cinerariifolium TaxID=118510 RepID=A0A699GQK3_TANCI|nr:hypothetical protein [Tanacetum cinerariifolium]GEV74503.1 hypothetical protein [Tanacetum cinerariifolium]
MDMERRFVSSSGKGGKQKKNASNNVASDYAKDSMNEEIDTSLSMLKNLFVNVDGLGNSYVTPGIDVKSIIIGNRKLNGGNITSNMHDKFDGIDPTLMMASNALDNKGKIHGNEKRNSIGCSHFCFYRRWLSGIVTKIGKPLMLDSYSDAMCTDSWVKASYARAMIELKADVKLRDTIAPPRCSECKIFRHILDDCPKKIISDIPMNSKMPRQPARGPPIGLKPKYTFVYRPVSTKKTEKANGNSTVQTANKATTLILNSFDALSTLVDEEEGEDGKLVLVDNHEKPIKIKVTNEASASKPYNSIGDQLVESNEDEVELPDDETSRYMALTGGRGFLEDDLDFFDG